MTMGVSLGNLEDCNLKFLHLQQVLFAPFHRNELIVTEICHFYEKLIKSNQIKSNQNIRSIF